MSVTQALGPDELGMRAWLYGYGTMGGLDWPTLLGLFVVALIYFLAPVAGYAPGQRGLLFAALWMLVARMALAMLRVALLAFVALDGLGRGKLLGGEALFSLFGLAEAALFVVAMVLFVAGLASLRRGGVPGAPPRRPFPDD
jgi:hypothetical protein